MRLISQNGMVDVPYENVCVSINHRNKNQITAWNFGCEDCEIVAMATYSTESKALKVMEMLRASYVNNECYKSLCSGIVIPLPNNSDDTKEKSIAINTFRRNMLFQFPADEEVEV